MRPGDNVTAFIGGERRLEAKAVDPEGEAVSYRWEVRQIADVHEHPDVFQADGQNVLFRIASTSIPGEYISYKVLLTVATDSMSTSDSFALHAEYAMTFRWGGTRRGRRSAERRRGAVP